MSDEPDSIVLRLLRDMRAEMMGMRGEMATKADLAALRSELASDMTSLRADVASDVATLQAEDKKTRKELGEQIAGLRQAVTAYHSSVVGHGVLISDLEARIHRVEQHLNLPPMAAN